MSLSDANQRLSKLYEAIEYERKQEEKFFFELLTTTPLQDRIDNGYTWFPVSLSKRKYSVGDFVEVTLDRDENQIGQSHKLKSGIGVRISKEGPEGFSYTGTVSYVRRDRIKILCYQEEILNDHRLEHDQYGVEMIYDERPYTVMKEALRKAIKKDNVHFRELKIGISDKKFPQKPKEGIPKAVISTKLNESQRNAVEKISQAAYIGIIHGPPGTGKTTTLVELIRNLCTKEKQILVCAPSNHAVDLLAGMLYQSQLTVLRVGNISRIDDDHMHLTLIEKIRAHPEWKRIKKVKKEADAALKKAKQYKRSFGPEEREERKQNYKEATELRKWARELEDRLTNQIIQNSQVICTTLVGASHQSVDHLKFQTVIIDEASQALEPACWNVLLKANRCILAGDHKQLAPIVKSANAVELGLDNTLLDQLADSIEHVALLKTQYRMNERILSFSNITQYDGQLQSDATVVDHTLNNDTQPLVIIDTAGCGFEEEQNQKNRSYFNREEYLILREFLIIQKEKQLGYSIGIIAPYSQQVRLIRDLVSEDDQLEGLDIEVNTVDGFQGAEKDIIYLSMVRSNPMGNIGFLKDARRLNVAMTRARKKLVIVGDFATLSYYPLFRQLAQHVEENGSYRSAWEFMM